MQHLSSYAATLGLEAIKRYKEKIAVIGGLDPFSAALGKPVDHVPPLEASDIVSYLILQTSFITSKQFKARKSLEAYNQFVCGWVKDVSTWTVCGSYLTVGRVRHSQRLNDTPLACWIILDLTGAVSCAHCNCMAGLGEVCTHIAAVLFYLEAAYRIKGKETCTQTKCEWLLPSFLKKIEYKPVRHIDFTSTNSKKRKLDEMIDSSSTSKQQQSDNHPATSTEQKVYTNIPNEKEMSDFFESLNHCGTIPVVLSLVPNYSDKFVKCNELPRPLQLLHDPKFMTLEYQELLNECASLKILLTKNQAEKVEIETRNQAKSNLWFRFRAGRVTASKMKAVCHTDALNPSQSLVKRVCYPEAF